MRYGLDPGRRTGPKPAGFDPHTAGCKTPGGKAVATLRENDTELDIHSHNHSHSLHQSHNHNLLHNQNQKSQLFLSFQKRKKK